MIRKLIALACTGFCAAMMSTAHAADAFPTKPIMLVVPFAYGGGNDLLARMVAEKMGKILGQPVVVDNRVGAGGVVGSRYVAKSAPDGYTLLLGFTGTLAVNPSLYANPGYDTQKDFEPVGRIGSLPMVLVVNSNSKITSLMDRNDTAKKEPRKLSFGSGGAGTLQHIAPEMVANRAGIQLMHVPYKSTAPAVTDVLGGQIDMVFSSPVAVASNISAGKLRAIAVTGPTRADILPNVPTMAESGLPGFSAISSYGLVAPAKTPPAVIAVLNKALNESLALDDVKKKMLADATVPQPGTPRDYERALKAETDTWGSMVRKLGLKED